MVLSSSPVEGAWVFAGMSMLRSISALRVENVPKGAHKRAELKMD